jgi:predicted MFS family arabinose efflux permease
MAFARYRAVLRQPAVGWLLVASLVGRLATPMSGLSLVLFAAAASGSYADAGAVVAAHTVGIAVSNPVLGRVADRLGQRRVLVPTAAIYAAALCSLTGVSRPGLPAMLALALVAGLSQPPVAASARALWPQVVTGQGELATLYAAEATLQEIGFIAGPAVVAAVTAALGAHAAPAFTGVVQLVGTTAFVAHPATTRRGMRAAATDRRRPLRSAGLQTLLVAGLCVVAGLNAVEVGVAAFAREHHAPASAGVLVAVWSAGSLVGGLMFGAQVAGSARRVLGWLLVATALGFLLLVAGRNTPELGALLVLSGVVIAPTLGCVYTLVSRVSSEGSATEAFGWMTSAFMAGAAIGSAVGGAMVQRWGTTAAFDVAALLSLGAVVVATVRRQTLDQEPHLAPAH